MRRARRLAAAFVAILAPALLAADSVTVTFDAALTNETEWVYNDTDANKDGNIFLRLHSSVTSPVFPFDITSVEITLACSNTNATRHLLITPSSGAAMKAKDVKEKGTREIQTFQFNEADAVRSFSISLVGSGSVGNWYIYTAVISGVPILGAPTGLAAEDVHSTRCRLVWENPANAASNRIDVSLVSYQEGAAQPSPEYDFSSFANDGGNPVERTADFTNQLPAFAESSLVYLPANSAGVIQISNDSNKGYLVHTGFDDYTDLSLLISLRIPNISQGRTFGIGYEATPGVTNEFAQLRMLLDFRTNIVSLASVPPGVPLIFNTQGIRTKRRVQIDYLAFVRGDSATYTQTTPFAAFPVLGGCTAGIDGLAPSTDYLVTVTAFDVEGYASAPSEPIEIQTTAPGSDAFTLKIK